MPDYNSLSFILLIIMSFLPIGNIFLECEANFTPINSQRLTATLRKSSPHIRLQEQQMFFSLSMLHYSFIVLVTFFFYWEIHAQLVKQKLHNFCLQCKEYSCRGDKNSKPSIKGNISNNCKWNRNNISFMHENLYTYLYQKCIIFSLEN
jgi:hypothetical protein